MSVEGRETQGDKLTAEQRSEIFQKQAGLARWSKRPLQATHKGSFREILELMSIATC